MSPLTWGAVYPLFTFVWLPGNSFSSISTYCPIILVIIIYLPGEEKTLTENFAHNHTRHLPVPLWCQIHHGPFFLWILSTCVRHDALNSAVVHIETEHIPEYWDISLWLKADIFCRIYRTFSTLGEYSCWMKMWSHLHEISWHQQRRMPFSFPNDTIIY